MASKLALLRNELEEVSTRAKALNDQFKAKAMPPEKSDELDGLLDRVEQLHQAIKDEGTENEKVAASADRGAGSSFPVLRNSTDFRRHYRRAPGLSASRQNIDMGDFIRGVAGVQTSEPVRAALTEGTDTAGGFLVPNLVMPLILEAMVPESAVLTAGAGIIPLDQGAKTYTLAGIDTIPTAAWRLESGDIPESEPTFRAVIARPQSLAFMFKVSRELLADGQGLGEAATLAIAQAFARAMDQVALRGSGVLPEPAGLANIAAVPKISTGTNGLAFTNYLPFFAAMQSLLQENAPMPGAAIMSPRSRVRLGSFSELGGQPLNVPPMLEPVRMLYSTAVPDNLTVGTSNDCSQIYLGDFTKLYFAMRERVSIARASELYAKTGQVAFFGHARVDVMVAYPKAFAVINGLRS
jgi:HK97 family phage major capsid protein